MMNVVPGPLRGRRSDMIIRFNFDGHIGQLSTLRPETITKEDLPWIRALRLSGWTRADEAALLQQGKWIANADRSIVFKGAGGGSFELPELYDLYYRGSKARLECGGDGLPAKWHTLAGESAAKLVVQVTGLHLPPPLEAERDTVLALMAEAFAVGHMNPHPAALTVQFRMVDWGKDAFTDDQLEADAAAS
jgi:hypothetical protein